MFATGLRVLAARLMDAAMGGLEAVQACSSRTELVLPRYCSHIAVSGAVWDGLKEPVDAARVDRVERLRRAMTDVLILVFCSASQQRSTAMRWPSWLLLVPRTV